MDSTTLSNIHFKKMHPIIKLEADDLVGPDFLPSPEKPASGVPNNFLYAHGTVDRKILRAIAKGQVKETTTPGLRKGVLFMVVSEKAVEFYASKQRFFGYTIGEKLIEHTRDTFLGMELHNGETPTAHIFFKDGTHYELRCPESQKRKAQSIIVSLYKGA